MGFDDAEIVALSGARTLGRGHADRSGFEGPWTHDPLNFDHAYYKELLDCKWAPTTVPSTGKPQLDCPSDSGIMMLHTDVALVRDDAFRPYVVAFADDQARFFAAFASAFQKLQENGHAGLEHVSTR